MRRHTRPTGAVRIRHKIIEKAYLNNENYDFFFLSRLLPPNAEGSAELCEAIGASLRTQVRIVLSCLLTLAPSVNLSVDTFPDKRGRLTFPYSLLFRKKSFTASRKRISPLPSFLSGGQNRNDDRRKNII